MRVVVHIVAGILHVLLTCALLLAVVSSFVPASMLPVPIWFGLLFEWLIGAQVVLLLYWLCTSHRKWCWLSVAAIVCAIVPLVHTVSHAALFFPKKELPHSFTLMSYNTQRMGNVQKPAQNRIIHYILRTAPDVVCLQEVEVSKSDEHLTLHELRKALDIYPYTYFDFKIYNKHRQYGNVVFSKYPLVGKRTLRYESRGNITSVCDIVLPTDTIRLYTNHLESNRVHLEDFEVPASSSQTQTVLSNTTAKLEKASVVRNSQATAIHDDAQLSPHPVLIVGDMNTTPASYTYHQLQRGMRDAFLEGSNGELGHTYELHGIGIRIDYIFHSTELGAGGFNIPHVDYSDHYPIITTIYY